MDAFGNLIKKGDKVIFSDCESARIYVGYVAHISNSRCWICSNHDECDKWTYKDSIWGRYFPKYFRKDLNRVVKIN